MSTTAACRAFILTAARDGFRKMSVREGAGRQASEHAYSSTGTEILCKDVPRGILKSGDAHESARANCGGSACRVSERLGGKPERVIQPKCTHQMNACGSCCVYKSAHGLGAQIEHGQEVL